MAKKILVIDDEPDILRVIIFRLKKLGHEVLSAIDGGKGLELIKAQRPDIVLLDYRMPVMDGLQVIKAVRSDEVLKNTVLIMLSASSGGDIEILAKEAQVNDFMKKPFEPEKLLAKIQSYC